MGHPGVSERKLGQALKEFWKYSSLLRRVSVQRHV